MRCELAVGISAAAAFTLAGGGSGSLTISSIGTVEVTFNAENAQQHQHHNLLQM